MTKELPTEQLSYSLPHFAKVMDLSVTTVREQIDGGYLVPQHPHGVKKPLITKEEAARYRKAMPQDD